MTSSPKCRPACACAAPGASIRRGSSRSRAAIPAFSHGRIAGPRGGWGPFLPDTCSCNVFSPDVIWSTYPIATAHSIGATLQRLTGRPWVADFRDPMAQEGYPADPRVWAAFKRIEEKVAARAKRLVFTTPSACETYRARYADRPREQFALIENGYDEETFPAADTVSMTPLNPGALTLLHSGIVYPSERDPSQLVAALAQLSRRAPAVAHRLRVRFRAAVHDELLHTLAREHGVASMIEVMPAIPYREAIEEMLRADALLVLQAANCNEQIPAKLYEYFRAGRPIIALTDPAGDTGCTVRDAGYDAIAPLDDPAAIARILEDYVLAPQAFAQSVRGDVTRYSRRGRTAQLAALLAEVV